MGWNFQPLVLAVILIWHLDMHWIFYGAAFAAWWLDLYIDTVEN